MGTTWHVTAVGRAAAPASRRRSTAGSTRSTRTFSTYLEDSEINRFSRFARAGEAFPASRAFLDVMRTAARVHELSGGAWDGTVRPLVDLWGFGPRPPVDEPPDPKAIEALLVRGRVRHDRDPGGGARQEPGLGDPRPVVDRQGIRRRPGRRGGPAARASPDFLVEIGGEVYAAGLPPGRRALAGGDQPPSLRRGAGRGLPRGAAPRRGVRDERRLPELLRPGRRAVLARPRPPDRPPRRERRRERVGAGP